MGSRIKYIVAQQGKVGEIWFNRTYDTLPEAEIAYNKIIKSRATDYRTIRIVKDTDISYTLVKAYYRHIEISCKELVKL